MSAALQVSEEKLAKSVEREAALEKDLERLGNEQQKTLEKYHELKEKYAGNDDACSISNTQFTLTACNFESLK